MHSFNCGSMIAEASTTGADGNPVVATVSHCSDGVGSAINGDTDEKDVPQLSTILSSGCVLIHSVKGHDCDTNNAMYAERLTATTSNGSSVSPITFAVRVITNNKPHTKMCGKCKQQKSTFEFYRNKCRADGLQSSCVACARGCNRKELAARRSSGAYIRKLRQAAVLREAAKRSNRLARQLSAHWKVVLTSANGTGLVIADDVFAALVGECSSVILSVDTDETAPAVAQPKDIKVCARFKAPLTKVAVTELVGKALGSNAVVKAITPEFGWNGSN